MNLRASVASWAGRLGARAPIDHPEDVAVTVAAGRVAAIALTLNEPVEVRELETAYGSAVPAWLPGGQRTLRWTRSDHRVVADLDADGRITRVWLGP